MPTLGMGHPHSMCKALAKSGSHTKSNILCDFAFEKHLILEEIASLSDRLRNQAAGDCGADTEGDSSSAFAGSVICWLLIVILLVAMERQSESS